MHADVTDRHHRHLVLRRHLGNAEPVRFIEGAQQQVQSHPRTAGKRRFHPRRLGVQLIHILWPVRRIVRQQNQRAIRQAFQMRKRRRRRGQVGRRQQITALGHAVARQCDDFAKIAISLTVARQRQQRRSRRAIRMSQPEVAADDERDLALGLGVSTHYAGQRAFIRDGQRRIIELHRARNHSSACEAPCRKRNWINRTARHTPAVR
jgi:hypothetical protein